VKYDYEIDMTTDNLHSLILKRITPGSKVFEFGPATGYMTRYMKRELGCYICCIELEQTAAEVAKQFSDQMIVADIDCMDWSPKITSKDFDYVLFIDVLEHLKNPQAALNQAVCYLKTGGVVITSIPNVAHGAIIMELIEGKFEYRSLGLLDDTHLRFFTRRSILHLLESANLYPIEWLNTFVSPEDTEFRQKYSSFPGAIEQILASREDNNVYQFVTVSKKVEELNTEHGQLNLLTHDGYQDYLRLQVYWEINNEFDEVHSTAVPLVRDKGMVSYDLELPLIPKRLRLDPGGLTAYNEIQSITILEVVQGNVGESIITWDKDNEFLGMSLGQGVIDLGNQEFKSLLIITNDPQVLLETQLENDFHATCIVRIVMSITEDIPAEILNRIINVKNELGRIKDELRRTRDEWVHTKDELVHTKDELGQTKDELGRAKDELGHTKVELEQTKSRHMNAKAAWISTKVDFLNSKDGFEETVSQLNSHLNELRTTISQERAQLDLIKKSTSWRITAPLRKMGDICQKLLNKKMNIIETCLRKKFKPQLVPAIGLQPTDDDTMWISGSNDPQFEITTWPTGWVLISIKATADNERLFKFYIDKGNGFSEVDSIIIGIINDKPIISSVIYLDPLAQRLRLDPGDNEGTFYIKQFDLTKISKLEVLIRVIVAYLKNQRPSLQLFYKLFKIMLREGIGGFRQRALNQIMNQKRDSGVTYETWLANNRLSEEKEQEILKRIQELPYKPVFSVLVPVFNVEEQWLRRCISSVKNQLYPYWELCIADDASPKSYIRRVLKEIASTDSRIKIIFRDNNGHISAASNSALELATGEYVALLDHDDELAPDALYENAVLLNVHPEADFIYSDEDKISEDGDRNSPFFKPDWSPDTLLSQMYTCHLGVYRTSLIKEIGGFREGFEGSQDYDLVLRFTERTKNIYHIPKILYHWRAISESTASDAQSKGYAHEAGLKAIEEALLRRGEDAWVDGIDNFPHLYKVHYKLKHKPLISIIIPTRDYADVLGICLDSIFKKSTYQKFEVVIIDNGSIEQKTFNLFSKWERKEPERFQVKRLDIPFNYSKLNNEGVRLSKGELVLLLNNDIEVITPNWLEEMAGQAVRSNIGVVGAKLLYPDNTVQHAGVILGIGGVAGHGHKGFQNKEPGYFGALFKITNVSAVTGACLMVRKELFESVKGLDEELMVAFNDVDFCLKVKRKGLFNINLAHVELYHHESKSRGYEDTLEKQERFKSEILLMQKRWGDILTSDPFYSPNLTLEREDFELKIDQ